MSAETLPDAGQVVSHIDCETTVRRLWDYIDGRLPDLAREEVEAHLAACVHCPPRFAFARTMRQALETSAERDRALGPADALEAALRARVREALRRQIVPSGLGDDG